MWCRTGALKTLSPACSCPAALQQASSRSLPAWTGWTMLQWGGAMARTPSVPNSCGSEYCGESWSYTTPSERCSGACEDHPACRHWLLVGDTCHLLDHPGPGLQPLSSGGGGSAGSSSRAATPPTPGESLFVATCHHMPHFVYIIPGRRPRPVDGPYPFTSTYQPFTNLSPAFTT